MTSESDAPRGLPPEARSAVLRVSAALAASTLPGRDELLDEALSAADRDDWAAAVEEVLVQGYLFLGYPAALNALARWRRLSGRPAPEAAREDREEWAERGARVCRAVYGGQYEGLRRNVRALHPDMERWMVEEGYGKVLGRPGLALVDRELCVVALLAVLGVPRQLHSHLRGALQVGAEPTAVEEALATAARATTDPRRVEEAGSVWASVLERWQRNGGG